MQWLHTSYHSNKLGQLIQSHFLNTKLLYIRFINTWKSHSSDQLRFRSNCLYVVHSRHGALAKDVQVGRVEYQYFRQILEYLSSQVKSSQTIRVFEHIFASIFDSRLSNLPSIHQFYYSALTGLRTRTFSIHLNNESQVRTPLRQNLTDRFQVASSCL